MSKPIEEILAPKPEARPRIYAYSIDDEAHKGLLKVGQTTRDVKQRVAEQLKTAAIKNYTIELDEPAERDDGTIFTDHEVRAALVREGLREHRAGVDALHGQGREDRAHRAAHRAAVHRHASRDVRDAPRAGRGREQDARLLPLDLEGGHARRPALPVEREDALRQDLHHLPARQEARRQARARGDLQARRRGCVADGPRVPRRLRRLAVPLAQLRQRSDEDRPPRSRSSTSAPSRTCSAATTAGNIKAKNEWLHKINWDLVVFDEYHFGAWRETAKELFEGEDEAVAKKEAKLEYAAGLEDVNEDLERALGEGDRVPAHHHQGVPLPLRHAVQGAGHGRVHRGADLQLDLHRRAARQGRVRREAPRQVEPLRRAAADAPADLPDARRAAGDRERRASSTSSTSTSSSRPRHGRERAVQAQERRAEVAGHHPRRVRAEAGREPQDRARGRRSRTRTCACCRTCSTRSGSCRTSRPATRWRTCWPRSTTPSGTTTRCVVAAGASAGIGLDALPPVRKAIGSGFDTKTITLSCGKLTTGVTVPQWSSILMLRNLKSPETYFQAAFRVQSPWSIKNPNGDNPNEEEILKPVCFVFDFAPTRALRQLVRVRRSGCRPTSRTRRTPSRTSCRSCPCWPTTART